MPGGAAAREDDRLQRTNDDQLWTTTPGTPGALGGLRGLRRRFGRHAPPERASTLSGWAILPLRLFLGGTFAFAGLQKLANPTFFDASNPTSIQAQIANAARVSPIHALVAHLVHDAVLLGVLLALAEIAVGIGTLAGLFGRAAAAGGMVLSLVLFLTVSYHSSPYYTGSDIVFLFAWTPLLVAGTGGALSVDALLADKLRARSGLAPAPVVPVPFDTVQAVCGSYHEGTCRARGGAPCAPAPCPYLESRARAPRAPSGHDMDRRRFTLQGMAAAGVAALAMVAAGLSAALGRAAGGTTSASGATTGPSLGNGSGGSAPATSSPTTSPPTGSSSATTAGTPTTAAKPKGTPIGEASAVPVGGSASFTAPRTGDPAVVVQPVSGTFAAFDLVCPHEGCIVGYSIQEQRFICPCHGSQFNGRTGARLSGPAPHGLTRLSVQKGPDGRLYVT
jgi:thiosulfate dehydrogenase [quinone] large subunit